MKIKKLLLIILTFIFSNSFSQETVQDNEGNSYKTIKIGEQIWMQENLKTTHYNNGKAIPTIADPKAWGNATTGAYAVYEDKEKNKQEFGLYYNYYVIIDTGNVCPIGWHIPSDSDFIKLIDFMGGAARAGGKLKEKEFKFWLKPNTGYTVNDTFKARGVGRRSSGGNYYGLTTNANFWSKTSVDEYKAIAIGLECYDVAVSTYAWHKAHGFSIRCIKN